MGKLKSKTIIETDPKKFETVVDEFIDSLDGKVKQIVLHSAPDSKVAYEDPETGSKGQIYYNHHEGIIIYKPAKHLTKKQIIDKYKSIKKKLKFKNKSKKIDKVLEN